MTHCNIKALLLLFLFSGFFWSLDASQGKPNSSQKPEEESKVVCAYKVIRIDVEVRDRHGKEVKDLTKDSFTIYEDGEKQILIAWQRIESIISNQPHTRYVVEYYYNDNKPSGYRTVRVVVQTNDKRRLTTKISPERYYATQVRGS